eukprot:3335045-Amphidinium_carterae.1
MLAPCPFLTGLPFFRPHPPIPNAQHKVLNDWATAQIASSSKERRQSWQTYVKTMWQQSPKRIYKWIGGTAVVWDLAIRGENGFALSPDDTAQVELETWSKLWKPGSFQLRRAVTDDPMPALLPALSNFVLNSSCLLLLPSLTSGSSSNLWKLL